MPAPIPYAHREEIIRRKQAGQSLAEIAAALGYSYWGVRQIWRRYRDRGEAGLRPSYRKGPGPIRKRREIYEQAIAWKRAHPRWGAGLIRSLLLQEWPAEEVPSERTLQRWWRREGLHRRPRRGIKQQQGRAREVHEVWQIDGVDGGRWSWVTVTDERSGAVLGGRVFPLRTGRADSCASGAGFSTGGDGDMGSAAADPGGQRPALGEATRTAHAVGFVADGIGD